MWPKHILLPKLEFRYSPWPESCLHFRQTCLQVPRVLEEEKRVRFPLVGQGRFSRLVVVNLAVGGSQPRAWASAQGPRQVCKGKAEPPTNAALENCVCFLIPQKKFFPKCNSSMCVRVMDFSERFEDHLLTTGG